MNNKKISVDVDRVEFFAMSSLLNMSILSILAEIPTTANDEDVQLLLKLHKDADPMSIDMQQCVKIDIHIDVLTVSINVSFDKGFFQLKELR